MAPVFFAKIKVLDIPMDFNKKIGDIRILGDNKTIRGLLSATLIGGLIFILQKALYNIDFFNGISILNYWELSWWFGFIIGLGVICGDAIKSFVKRKTKKGGPKQVHPLHPRPKSVRPSGVRESEAGEERLKQLTLLKKGGSL